MAYSVVIFGFACSSFFCSSDGFSGISFIYMLIVSVPGFGSITTGRWLFSAEALTSPVLPKSSATLFMPSSYCIGNYWCDSPPTVYYYKLSTSAACLMWALATKFCFVSRFSSSPCDATVFSTFSRLIL